MIYIIQFRMSILQSVYSTNIPRVLRPLYPAVASSAAVGALRWHSRRNNGDAPLLVIFLDLFLFFLS
jgi:hypothetical protein